MKRTGKHKWAIVRAAIKYAKCDNKLTGDERPSIKAIADKNLSQYRRITHFDTKNCMALMNFRSWIF